MSVPSELPVIWARAEQSGAHQDAGYSAWLARVCVPFPQRSPPGSPACQPVNHPTPARA